MASLMLSGSRQRGVSYLMLLLALAIIGAISAYSVQLGFRAQRWQAEAELLRVGAEFEKAFASFRAARPVGNLVGNPRELQALLRDSRYPSLRRHLRQIYADPLGEPAWGILRAPDGSILGVYSLAAGAPLRQHGFEGARAHFNNSATYSDWVFGMPAEVIRGAVTMPPPPGS